jgi:hypothetical protein
MGSSFYINFNSTVNGRGTNHILVKKFCVESVLGKILGQKGYSPASAPGPWGKIECLPFLHKTAAPAGSHPEKTSSLAHRESNLFHDNACFHTAYATKQLQEQFYWKCLDQTPNSSDPAP